MNTIGYLRKESNRLKLDLADEVLAALVRYDSLLMRWNATINLTRMLSLADRVHWMYGESLWGARRTQPQGSLLDVGSGCGFPGLAFKLLDQSIRVILVESRTRKAHFLKEVIRTLDLSTVEVRSVRIEEAMRDSELYIDNICWRAVVLGPRVLHSLASRLRVGGSLIFFGSPGSQDLQALQDLPCYRCCLKELVPGSEERIVVQFVKRST